MFTGFATENTPVIKFWNFFSTAVTTGSSRVSLTDDCAPIQYFRTGGSTSSILLYLPTCPIEGKSIRIINAYAATNAQTITIYSSDTTISSTAAVLYTLGQGDSIELIYSKDWRTYLGYAANTAGAYSGWLALNRMPYNAVNGHSAILSGNNNRISSYTSVIAGGEVNIASNIYAFIGAGTNNTASGQYSSVVGGSFNTASGNYSVSGGGGNAATGFCATVAGGQNNTSGGSNAFIGGGYVNTNNSSYGTIGGGYANNGQSAGQYATIGGGVGITTSGNYSSVLGGNNNTANGTASSSVGTSWTNCRGLTGYVALGGGDSPLGANPGSSQTGVTVFAVQTTDATPTVLRSDANAASTANQLYVPIDGAIYFEGECVASVATSSGSTKGWKIAGVAKKGASHATVALVGTPTVTSSYADGGTGTWTLAVATDTTNGNVKITVTGNGASTIRWVCNVRTTEMTIA